MKAKARMLTAKTTKETMCWIVRLMVLCQIVCTHAVDRSKFRTCEQTRFCRVHRSYTAPEKYEVDSKTVALDDSGRLGMVLKGPSLPPLAATVSALAEGGIVRLRIVDEAKPRWEASDILLASTEMLQAGALAVSAEAASWSFADGSEVVIRFSPFRLEFFWGGPEPLVIVNGENLLHWEYAKEKSIAELPKQVEEKREQSTEEECASGSAWDGEKCQEIVGYWEDGLARFADGGIEVKRVIESKSTEVNENETKEVESYSESFGGHTDNVVNGPSSIGLDLTFPQATGVYGLAEHASRFKLKSTKGKSKAYQEPYRFYNLDVFEYDLDVPMALYGTIPLAWGVNSRNGRAIGAFWNNPSETFVDVMQEEDDDNENKGSTLHWLSESGVIELFLMASEPGSHAFKALAKMPVLVGAQEMPPIFALGYHQCRWNYKDERDVAAVHNNFELLDIPYDVLWLDIEHTHGKRYFTWDESLFPDPISMQQNLSRTGRKMVTIVDPHIKRDSAYSVHTEATKLGFYIKDKSGKNDFEGWCWPGSSSYLDFTSAEVRKWWAERFLLSEYEGSTLDLFTWNDMNEPSVFDGPEVTMSKECQSLNGIEHREWHNLYGMYFHRATAEGLELRGRSPEARAVNNGDAARGFVLTRSFYAGSQRWGAVWTGDNAARWDHLQIATPMLLSLAVCGFSFAGADAGGFFGDPDAELMARWIAAAAYTPFFRGHAHHDAKRREPWSFGEPWTGRLRNAIADRYTWLPLFYTLFAEARFTGVPIMRPMWAHFSADDETNAKHLAEVEDQWLLGSDLLVKPAVTPKTSSVEVYFPPGASWFEVREPHTLYSPATSQRVSATLDEAIPTFQRAGSILSRKKRLRRSTVAMRLDPYEVTVALDPKTKSAEGMLYTDDTSTFAFRDRDAFAWTQFSFSDNILSCSVTLGPDLPPHVDAGRARSLGLLSSAPSNSCETDDATCLSSLTTEPLHDALQVPIERLIILGLDQPPSTVTLRIPDRPPQSLEFLWAPAYNKLTVRKPDAPIGQPWTIAFTF